jgi:polyisoprenoid-binding protein YceI
MTPDRNLYDHAVSPLTHDHSSKEIHMPEMASALPQAISDLTGSWSLDPQRTTVQFTTKALWITTVNGTLRATDGTGTVDVDGRVTGRIDIDPSSIDTKNKKRDEHLRNADFFDVQNYPSMVFDVTNVQFGAPGQSTLQGTLSLHGVSRTIEFEAALRTESDEALTLDVHTKIDRSEWGLRWTKMGAGLHNSITITATFVRR